MPPVKISTRQEYDYCVLRGYEPLINDIFDMDIALRLQIQREKFGRGHTMAENERFYRWCWGHYPHKCQETLRRLDSYSAVYISHILTRGAHPAMAHDPRNVNILSFEAHNKWENGDRQSMRIYAKNQITIKKLLNEYRNL